MALLERLPVGPDTAQWPLWSTTARVVVDRPRRLVAGRAPDHRAGLRRGRARPASRFRPDAEIHWVARDAGGRSR